MLITLNIQFNNHNDDYLRTTMQIRITIRVILNMKIEHKTED